MAALHRMKINAKAIIFDLDGTLLDTLTDIAESVNQMLADRHFPVHSLDAYRFFVGDGWTMLITRALPEPQRTASVIEKCGAQAMEIYRRNWNRRTRPYDGVLELLKAVGQKGIPMAVLSNKPHQATLQCIEDYFVDIPFFAVAGLRDGVPAKPDPTSALALARKLDLPADEIMFVGDSAVDMQTAVAAGMQAVGAEWGFRGAQELRDAGCRKLVGHPREVLDLLP